MKVIVNNTADACAIYDAYSRPSLVSINKQTHTESKCNKVRIQCIVRIVWYLRFQPKIIRSTKE